MLRRCLLKGNQPEKDNFRSRSSRLVAVPEADVRPRRIMNVSEAARCSRTTDEGRASVMADDASTTLTASGCCTWRIQPIDATQ
jgi:hypothetical protein